MQEKLKQIMRLLKQNVVETFRLLWKFKWYIFPYMLFYAVLLMFYLSPSPKQYSIWKNKVWYNYDTQSYLEITKLTMIIFLLTFFIGTSNMKNHPALAKLIFLSSLWFLAVFLEMI